MAVPWAWRAATSDETGLWLVGLLFLVVGVGLGLALVVGITVGIADRRRGR